MRLGDARYLETDLTYSGSAAFTPEAYLSQIEAMAPGITEQANRLAQPGEDWVSLIARTVSTLAMTDAQRQLLKVQIERARQGLAPLDASQYGIGATVGLSPATLRTLLIGGGILAAVLLLRRR